MDQPPKYSTIRINSLVDSIDEIQTIISNHIQEVLTQTFVLSICIFLHLVLTLYLSFSGL